MPYHFPIKAGDRVALAPHTDLWMQGVRFGNVTETMLNEENQRLYLVEWNEGANMGWLGTDDLLGAVRHPSGQSPLDTLRHHVSGAIERGEAEPIVSQ